MKQTLLLLITIILSLSCAKHESKETTNPIDDLKEQRQFYIEQVPRTDVNLLFKKRCDRLTFQSFMLTFTPELNPLFDIYDFEYPSGVWHRDVIPCYPEDSKSEISFEVLLGVIAYAHANEHYTTLKDLYDYGLENNHVYGEGDRQYTFNPHATYLAGKALGQLSLTNKITATTHKEHVTAMTILVRSRVNNDTITSAELLTLKTFKLKYPNTPLFHALYAKFTNGDQSKTIELLKKGFR